MLKTTELILDSYKNIKFYTLNPWAQVGSFFIEIIFKIYNLTQWTKFN